MMKYFKNILFVSLIALFVSCSITKKTAKSITGKWEITSIKEDVSGLNSSAVNMLVNKMLQGSYVDFKSDKTFKMSVLNKVKTGIWHISENGKRILTSDVNEFFEITEISENKLTLKSVKKDSKVFLGTFSKFPTV